MDCSRIGLVVRAVRAVDMWLMAGPMETELAAVGVARTDCWPAACSRFVDTPADSQYAKVQWVVWLAVI